VEVVSLGGGSITEAIDVGGFHGDDAVEVLELAFDEEEALAEDLEFELVEGVGSDDGVHDAGFVFHAKEDETFGGAWALTDDDGSGDADSAAVGNAFEVNGALDAERVQFGTPMGHGMFADGESGAAEIGPHALFGIHGGKRGGLAGLFERCEERPDG